ncbi:MAG TPA: hypothetical protein VM846_02110 [Vicinamibacterales bacterium]|jgi:hypothetical protein|nr:hypothetical protein [Vicinamibacterales bacterium]
MTTREAAVFLGLALLVSPLAAQDKNSVPEDSLLVTLNGCTKDELVFTVGPRREDQPGSLEVRPGTRFRLKGERNMLRDIRSHRRHSVQVTGLVRKIDLINDGVGFQGGQVRIKALPPVPQKPVQDPAFNPVRDQPPILDVQSWGQITGECR